MVRVVVVLVETGGATSGTTPVVVRSVRVVVVVGASYVHAPSNAAAPSAAAAIAGRIWDFRSVKVVLLSVGDGMLFVRRGRGRLPRCRLSRRAAGYQSRHGGGGQR